MNRKEKLSLLKELLDKHSEILEIVSDSNLDDYMECLQLLMSSADPIIQKGCISTCYLIIQKTKKLHSLL